VDGLIDAAELGEKLTGFSLEAKGKVGGLAEGFLDFDLGLIVIVEFEDDICEAFEERVHGTIEGEFDVAGVESSLLGVVVADFQ